MRVKQLNPCYFWFSENLRSEQAIAGARLDLNSYAMTLTASKNVFDKSKVKKDFEWLIEEIESKSFDVRYSIAMAISLYLADKHRFLSLKRNTKKRMFNVFLEVLNKKLPNQIYIDSYYFLKHIKFKGLGAHKKLLLDFREKVLSDDDSIQLLELEFSLGSEYFSQNRWDAFVDSEALSTSKLSKLGLMYLGKNPDKVGEIIRKLEEKCFENMTNASLPLISLAIYEAEKMINTNLPASGLKEVLKTLKKEKRKWAQIITNIENNGITVDLKRLSQYSQFTIGESLWSLAFLESASRYETYQITEVEEKHLKNYQTLLHRGQFITSVKDMLSFILFNVVFLILSIFLIMLLVRNALTASLKAVIVVVGIIVTLKGFYVAHKSYWKNGVFSLKSWLESIFSIGNLPI